MRALLIVQSLEQVVIKSLKMPKFISKQPFGKTSRKEFSSNKDYIDLALLNIVQKILSDVRIVVIKNKYFLLLPAVRNFLEILKALENHSVALIIIQEYSLNDKGDFVAEQ